MVIDVKGKKLNLLPESLRQKQQLKLRRKRVSTTLILLSSIVFLGLVGFAKEVHNRQVRIFYLDREINKTQSLALEVENMLKKIELIENQGKIEGSSVDVLREVHSLIPPDISLAAFSYDGENKIAVFQGISKNMSEIFKFINSLEKSVYFKNVQLKYVSEKKAKAGGLTDFKIECNLEK